MLAESTAGLVAAARPHVGRHDAWAVIGFEAADAREQFDIERTLVLLR